MDTPLSQSGVTLRLEEIQKRCSELMEDPHGLAELSLEEAMLEPDPSDPYNQPRG